MVINFNRSFPVKVIAGQGFLMKFFKNIHRIKIINMDDDLENIIFQSLFSKLILDVCCFLSDQDICFFIIGECEQVFCRQNIRLVQHLFIRCIPSEHDYTFIF